MGINENQTIFPETYPGNIYTKNSGEYLLTLLFQNSIRRATY